MKKYDVLRQLVEASKTTNSEGITTLTGITAEGRTLSVNYTEGCTLSGISVYRTDTRGIRYNVKVSNTDRDPRARIVRDGQQIYLGELIQQLDRLANGYTVMNLQYNHIFPAAFWQDAAYSERFGVKYGELVPSYLNKLHWGLCSQIMEQTGYLVEISCYSPCFRILLGSKLILPRIIEALDRQGLLKIMGKVKEVE